MRFHRYSTALLLIVTTGLVTAGAVTGPDYQLLLNENSFYRSFSRTELEGLIGSDQKLLAHYVCDGRTEFTLFPEQAVVNDKKNSLRIKANDSDEVIVYREGRYWDLDGKPIPKLKDKFFKQVDQALKKLEVFESSRTLLRELEKSRYPVVITLGGEMRFDPSESEGDRTARSMACAMMIFQTGRKTTQANGKLNHIGVGGKVIWNPEIKISRFESDGVQRDVPSYLSLVHELFHAFDGVRGLLDPRSVWNLEKYEQAEVAEYRAVYFENLLRKESGLKFSKWYGQADEGADMLDDDGQPIFMPTPCL